MPKVGANAVPRLVSTKMASAQSNIFRRGTLAATAANVGASNA